MKAPKEIKPIEYYLEANYPVTVYQAPEGGYVAEIEDLPGCMTEAETAEDALKRIEDARRAWIEVAYEDGLEIPLPRTDQEYSGKFLVRIPKGLHRRLAEQASAEGVSLNQYVETLLATKSTLQSIRDLLQAGSECTNEVVRILTGTQIYGAPSVGRYISFTSENRGLFTMPMPRGQEVVRP